MTDQSRPITSVAHLEALYEPVLDRSLTKELDHLIAPYRAFIEKAPFAVIATAGAGGLDCSPRGDPHGFIRVVDDKTLLIPDRRGNNRLDSLRNLIEDPRIALLFLIPGVNETLRINGRAAILADADLCAGFAINGKVPKIVIRVSVDSVYYQCPKALVRSKLWSEEARVPRAQLPSMGDIMAAITDGEYDGAKLDRDYPEIIKETIY